MRRLNIHKLVISLNDLCDSLEKDYDINCGGCCFVAYEIAKHLDRLNIQYKLIVADREYHHSKIINKEVRTKKRNFLSIQSVTGYNTCSHYYLEICGGGFVNPGYVREGGYKNYSITLVNHSHINWIYRSGVWNDMYDTSNNKIIKKRINSHFKQYGKNHKI